MGIFDSLKIKSSNTTTSKFYFGSSEAEGENLVNSNLLDYFDDYLSILNKLKQGHFIFTGRKGVGKSAIAKYIKDSSDLSQESFATLLKIGDYELENYIQETELQESKEKLIFEWLILVNLVKLIVRNDCGSYTKEFNKLKRFLDINSGIIDIDKRQFIVGEKNKGGEVNFSVLKHAFGGVFKHYFRSSVNKAPFYKLISPLKDVVKIILNYPINKNREFWLLFDDLDINYKASDESSNKKIIELIRVCKEYNNNIFKDNNAKIIIFIRDDIRDFIVSKYADSAKIFNSYETLINWYSHSKNIVNENELPLKKLIDKRIKIGFEKSNSPINTQSPWASLFKSSYINNKTSFKYILDFTFYRPRDIITFLKKVSDEDCTYPIEDWMLKQILAKYIKANILEIKSELNLFFSSNEINTIFENLFPYVIKNQDLIKSDLILKIEQLGIGISSENTLNLLLKYSLIIIKDNKGNLYFDYRDDTDITNLNESECFYTLPKCIYHYYNKIS